MTNSELWDLFHDAACVLVGTGPVKQRLIDAWRAHLGALRGQELPDALRARYIALDAAMHGAHATGGLTGPEASVRKMSEKEAAEHAAAVLAMFATLCATAGQDTASGPRLRVVPRVADEADEVPGFLSRA
jgi:hypothetical protein